MAPGFSFEFFKFSGFTDSLSSLRQYFTLKVPQSSAFTKVHCQVVTLLNRENVLSYSIFQSRYILKIDY